MKNDPEIEINSHILDSMLLLYCNALRVDDLDSKLLPMYDKYKVKHNVYTYQCLAKLYLNLTDYKMVKNLYRKLQSQPDLRPNKAFLNCSLEASIRSDDADIVYDSLIDFVEIKQMPHKRILSTLNNMKHIPDRIFVVLKENFGYSGQMTRRTREFPKAIFRGKNEDAANPKPHNGKRIKHKKIGRNRTMTSKDRKIVNLF